VSGRLAAAKAWLGDLYGSFSRHEVPRLGAALSYYTSFSLSPLLVVVVAIAGVVFGREAAEGQLRSQIEAMAGPSGAAAITSMLSGTKSRGSGVLAGIVGVVLLLVGASGVFVELEASLNVIFEVKPAEGGGLGRTVRDRLKSFALVLGTGFLLLVSLVASAALSAVEHFAGALLGGFGARAIDLAVSLAVVSAMFATLYKLLPDADLAWRDVRGGALVAGVLFLIGKVLIGMYVGGAGFTSWYGAAGSLAVVLVWVYYSAQILFLGAEIAQMRRRRRGERGGGEGVRRG
jgi:membrane protein